MDSTSSVLTHSKVHKPKLVIMTGIPGSGKTTISKIIHNDFDFYRISTDELRQVIYNSNEENFDINLLFGVQFYIFEELMKKGFNIISDSNSATKNQREKLKYLAEKYKYSISNFYCDANIATIKNRVISRKYSDAKNKLEAKELDYYLSELEIPKNCIVLKTDEDFEENYKKIEEELKLYERK